MMTQLFSLVAACSNNTFLGFPTWYYYLPKNPDCTPQINNLNDVWLIVAAGIEILLRVAAVLAFVYIIFAGFLFLTSLGNPEKATQARKALLNAIIGLVIAVSAAAVVGFIAGSIK